MDRLLIHEFGHQYSGDHLSAAPFFLTLAEARHHVRRQLALKRQAGDLGSDVSEQPD